MRSKRVVAVLAAIGLLGLVSCSRDPKVTRQKYLESGDRYFEKGVYKAARIQYMNSKKADPRFGPAYYKLGLTDLKSTPPNVVEAYQAFVRAVELLGPDYSADRIDAMVKLSEIYLAALPMEPNPDQVIAKVSDLCNRLLGQEDPKKPVPPRDPFDGHRLSGDLDFMLALAHFQKAERDDAQKYLDKALAEYTTADQIKPGDIGVMMQLARVTASKSTKADFATAEQLYRKVIEKDKTYQTDTKFLTGNQKPTGPYPELYRLLMLQQKPDEAEKVFKLAFQNNPKQYLFLTFLAMHYAELNRRDEMLGVLQQIKSYSKEWDQAYSTVGEFYMRMGDGDSALREYREGMNKEPKRKVIYEKKEIEVLMRQNKQQEAAEINDQILKENPNDQDARGLEASLLLAKTDQASISKAINELQSVVTHAPDNFVARYNLGRAYLAQKPPQIEPARQALQKALELRPDYNVARQVLAQLQVSRGEYDAAYKTAEQMLQIDRGSTNARLIQSAALMGQKKYTEARLLLGAMLKATPNSPDVLYQIGVVNLQEGKYQEAEDYFRRSYDLNPTNPRGLSGIVETYMAQDKRDAAIKLLENESAKYPNRPDLVLAAGTVALRSGRYDIAISEFQKLLDMMDKTSTNRAEVYLRLGETYRSKGDYTNAIENLNKAREISPDRPDVLGTLGLVLDAAQRRGEARQVYEAALKKSPDNPILMNNLAFLLSENNGDLELALTYAQRAKQALPEMSEVNDTLGWIMLKKDLSDQAIDTFRQLVNKYPDHATYRYHLCMALNHKGDRMGALKECRQALNSSPSDEDKGKIEAEIKKLQ